MRFRESDLADKTTSSAFTLIELSLVLVIIALLIGGILVGQDLIKAAAIRSTIKQVESYNSAVNTFRTKYNGLPGDLDIQDATAAGLFVETGANAGKVGNQDGNGLIEGGAAAQLDPLGETIIFWRHLSDASLVSGLYGSLTGSAINAASGAYNGSVTNANLPYASPQTKINNADYFIVYALSGMNYYAILPIKTFSLGLGSYTYSSAGLTPVEAHNIDNKTDDGLPNTGSITALGIGNLYSQPSWALGGTVNKCIMSGTSAFDLSDIYNTVSGSGDTSTSCGLLLRFN